MKGLTLDVERQEKERLETDARILEINAQVTKLAEAFHKARVDRWNDTVTALEEIIQHELETHPLFGTDEVGGLAPCQEHPNPDGTTYRGLTKRATCPSCAAIYAGAGSLRAKVKELRSRAAKAKTKAKSLMEGFQSTSDSHWREFLFDREIGLGLTPTAFTTIKKEPMVDEAAIEELARRYGDVEVLGLRIELQHLLHRQRVVLALETDADGKIYFAVNLYRTSTGRTSSGGDSTDDDKARESSGGNGQNWNDRDRRLIIPSAPDRILAEADYSQIELRVMAHLARERRLLAALKAGVDIHAKNAALFFGCKPEDARTHQVWLQGKWQEARQGGKKGSHMMNYHCGPEKLGATMQPWYKRSQEEIVAWIKRPENAEIVFEVMKRAHRCQKMNTLKAAIDRAPYEMQARCANAATAAGWIEAYFGEYQDLRVYQDEQIAKATRDRYLIGTGGRRIDFYNWRIVDGQRVLGDAEEAVAFDPQWTTAMIGISMIPVMEKVADHHSGDLLMFVHDSFLVELSEAALENWWMNAKEALEREWPVMGEVDGELFRCPAEMKSGHNWGKLAKDNPEGLR